MEAHFFQSCQKLVCVPCATQPSFVKVVLQINKTKGGGQKGVLTSITISVDEGTWGIGKI